VPIEQCDRADRHVAAIYNSYSQGGWLEVGGTSEGSPIIAAVYALAGTPATGSYPSQDIWAHEPSGLYPVGSGYSSVPAWGLPTAPPPSGQGSGGTTYQASFWLHVDTAETTTTKAYDTLKVRVLNSSGTVLATLATFSNLNAASDYQQHSYSLSSYAGQTVTLKFTGTENSSRQTSFVIDTAVNVG
jgi:hypothetical protein